MKINEKHHSRRYKDAADREIQFDGCHVMGAGVTAAFSTVVPIAIDYTHRDIRIAMSLDEARALRDSLTRMINAKEHTNAARAGKSG